MGNCLVTKLKGVVNNPNLEKFGEFKLNVSMSSVSGHGSANPIKSLKVNRLSGNNVKLKFLDSSDSYFTDSTGTENYGKSHNQESGQRFYFTNPSAAIESDLMDTLIIEDKYDISIFDSTANADNPRPIINAEDFKYLSNLTYIGFSGIQLYGDLKDFLGNKPNLTNLSFNLGNYFGDDVDINDCIDEPQKLQVLNLAGGNYSKINGNLATLIAGSISLNILYIRFTSLEGDLHSVFQSWSSQGRTKKLSFIGNGIVEINGVAYPANTYQIDFDGQGGYTVSQ